MEKDILYIIMPAYNEEQNIKSVIAEWYPVIEKYNGSGKSRLVVVNDGSTDSTLKEARSMAREMPYLEVLDKPNSGHGATVRFAYEYALAAGAEYIFQTDSDGQTVAAEFEQFWEKRGQYDVLIGNRKNREDGISRIIVTKVLKLVLLMVFRMNVPDANTPFRLMKKEVLMEYLPDVPVDYNLTNVLLSVLFLYNDVSVEYLPISFRKRRGGTNSINVLKIIRIGLKSLKDFYVIKKNMKKHACICNR